jgi:hypothetical protein
MAEAGLALPASSKAHLDRMESLKLEIQEERINYRTALKNRKDNELIVKTGFNGVVQTH